MDYSSNIDRKNQESKSSSLKATVLNLSYTFTELDLVL